MVFRFLQSTFFNYIVGILGGLACILILQSLAGSSYGSTGPILRDDNLSVENVMSGLRFATGMAFLAPNDILVIEKDSGRVQRILNGELTEEPLLDVDVANQVERGLLGIAVSKYLPDNKTYVFLSYTEAEENGEERREEAVQSEEEENSDENGEQSSTISSGDGGEPIGNRLYRYELSEDGTKLVNPKMFLDLPYEPGPAHNGGVVAIGPDENVYVVIGNLYSDVFNEGGETTLVQNIQDGEDPDGRGGIIRVTQNGKVVNDEGILGDEHPLDMYYAYGIRNSFGIAFDPVTGNLWGTENGGFDEINLVEPGFNSGFNQITGSSLRQVNEDRFDESDLVDFDGKGQYSDPELDMGQHIAPTASLFFHSDRLGKDYENDMFVGSTAGTIFQFDLNDDRTELNLDGPLADKIADEQDDLWETFFGEDFGVITDLEVGPDGYLYVLNYEDNGSLYRIIPSAVPKGLSTGRQ